jgi:hypothetical protein
VVLRKDTHSNDLREETSCGMTENTFAACSMSTHVRTPHLTVTLAPKPLEPIPLRGLPKTALQSPSGNMVRESGNPQDLVCYLSEMYKEYDVHGNHNTVDAEKHGPEKDIKSDRALSLSVSKGLVASSLKMGSAGGPLPADTLATECTIIKI